MSYQPVDVLYIEDDVADADFARTAFQEIGCSNVRLEVVPDGDQAARYLGLHGTGDAPTKPDVVLLDLNIPKIHGKELLRLIKGSDAHQRMPVVVLSTSSQQKDVDEAYELGAAGYFAKPSGYAAYKGIFKAICDYWMRQAVLPSHESPPAP